MTTPDTTCLYPHLAPSTGYERGCRCPRCKEGKSNKQRKYYAKKNKGVSKPKPDRRRDPNRTEALKNGDPTYISTKRPCFACGGMKRFTIKTRPGYNCADCTPLFRQRFYANNLGGKHKARVRHLKNVFNLSLTEYDALFAQQGNVCAICKTDTNKGGNGENFHVDHCHETKIIRGILCGNCNIALGRFDSIELLESAMQYISASNTKQVGECFWTK